MLYENVLGWMTDLEVRVIQNLAKRVPDNGVIVEVGSFFGRSSCAWADSKPNATVICIDTFMEHYRVKHKVDEAICKANNFPESNKVYNLYESFLENTKQFSNIRMIRGMSPQGIQYTGESIDLFFLDASHTNPNDWENIEFFLPLIKSGGTISGHDYIPNTFPDVVENVAKLEAMLGVKAEIFEASSIWAIKLP